MVRLPVMWLLRSKIKIEIIQLHAYKYPLLKAFRNLREEKKIKYDTTTTTATTTDTDTATTITIASTAANTITAITIYQA